MSLNKGGELYVFSRDHYNIHLVVIVFYDTLDRCGNVYMCVYVCSRNINHSMSD